MKERLVLFILVSGLTTFLYVFQFQYNTILGLLLLIAGMTLYLIYSNLATKHKKRQLKKSPQVINPDYKPFVSVMIPAHNEDSVIADTVNNVLQMDYPKFEVIVIDDRSDDNTANVVRQLASKYPEKVIAMIRDKDAYPGK